MIKRFFLKIQKFADHWWYMPLVALLSALDAYVLVIPNDALMIPAVLARPKKWIAVALWQTFGSAIGAASFAMLTSIYGEPFIAKMAPHLLPSKAWTDSVAFLNANGVWGLTLISLSPFPQHAAVAIVGLAHMNVFKVFAAVVLGRTFKYLFICWCTVNAPQILRRLRIT